MNSSIDQPVRIRTSDCTRPTVQQTQRQVLQQTVQQTQHFGIILDMGVSIVMGVPP